jgi:hypothetical protein
LAHASEAKCVHLLRPFWATTRHRVDGGLRHFALRQGRPPPQL